jgi:hypothetical protein
LQLRSHLLGAESHCLTLTSLAVRNLGAARAATECLAWLTGMLVLAAVMYLLAPPVDFANLIATNSALLGTRGSLLTG